MDLSISERLITMLRGTIAVESTVGQGTTFTLTLDLGPLEGVELLDAPAAYRAAVESLPTAAELTAIIA